jgi:plastocyanin
VEVVIVELGSLRIRSSLVGVLVVTGALASGAVLAVPAAASTPRAVAAPSEVNLVAGLNDPKDPNVAVLEFLPQKAKVAKGTTVTWSIAGPEPHSVTFVPPGTAPPSVDKDPTLFAPTPPTGPYDGSTLVNSGVVPAGPTTQVQKFSMSFSKTGTYTYYCALHPNMVGTLQVTDDTQDSQQKLTKTGNQEKAKYLKEGEAAKQKLLATKPKKTKGSDGSTTWTVQMGASTAHTDVLAFAPVPAKIATGDHVTFVNNSAAPHTASFGGSLVPASPIAPDVMSAVPGPSPQTLTSGAYLNTGWLPPKVRQGPTQAQRSYTYDVPTAGQYQYECVLHAGSGMLGELDAS